VEFSHPAIEQNPKGQFPGRGDEKRDLLPRFVTNGRFLDIDYKRLHEAGASATLGKHRYSVSEPRSKDPLSGQFQTSTADRTDPAVTLMTLAV
jgi:hypothetical protein